MNQAQNGDIVAQANNISNKSLQVNGSSANGGTRKVTTLRDATQRAVAMYRTELGTSSEQFLNSCNSVEIFFDYVAGIRLREMPHHSSRWDKVLKWAEFFAAQVFGYSEEVSQFADHSQQAAQIIWASSRSLLEASKPLWIIIGILANWKLVARSKIYCSARKGFRRLLQLRPHPWLLPSSS